MASQLKQLVPYLLLLLCIVSISHACKCSDSDQDRRSNHTLKEDDFTFRLVDKEAGVVGFDLIRNLSQSAYAYNTRVLSTIYSSVQLWGIRPSESFSDSRSSRVDEASFSVTIVYQPHPNQDRTTSASYGNLVFLIIPFDILQHLDRANDSLASHLSSHDLTTTHRITTRIGDYQVSVAIEMLSDSTIPTTPTVYYRNGVMSVDIFIRPTLAAAAASNYSVWIDYDHIGRGLAVYVDLEGKPKPRNVIAEQSLNISSFTAPVVFFGLVSTPAQLLRTSRGIDFSVTVDDLPVYAVADKRGFLSRKMTILFSILGPVTATALMAIALACYFNSRYRRWHRDLDKLARSMERLPGVPTKVDFADINKATCNFRETMKLGGGGFGTVYRCTLPAAASKMDRPIDVAVKRFTRDVQNHRYDDFLAEVSIINRLRHKNIVPLVGWSYNKGEPLLVFEYMTNGSLDQHLFPKGASGCGAAIRRWSIRYEIIRGIATGLHYVHHEYEPMVLHRDIKASNVMLDSSFRARLGDFGLACTVAVDRESVTGVGGTWGYIAPEYAMCRKTTRQTDIFALGVLILEVVTGQRALADHHKVVDDDEVHITDRIWQLHREGRLSECVDSFVLAAVSKDDKEQMDTGEEAARLLLLGLACSNPNPSDRPTMPDVMQIIAKSAPPPKVLPQKPRFVWPPPEEWASEDDSASSSLMSDLDWSAEEQPMAQAGMDGHGRYAA